MAHDEDKQAQKAVEKGDVLDATQKGTPAAGPHAREQLTDHDKTPGTGSLPGSGQGSETDPGTG
ncbi:hypothetical protein [Rhizobium oryzicola]|uniref:Uncharacterized protein n=1 Tax=Rhizobium oryzicola TaxID=1232668 RepID=A0ABT8T3S9_9HYPH|nr:hypothetical protein [Rhizobium oryzicola]MDO1585235.1 hypothetical protein [Rhizobium oryzicola]